MHSHNNNKIQRIIESISIWTSEPITYSNREGFALFCFKNSPSRGYAVNTRGQRTCFFFFKKKQLEIIMSYKSGVGSFYLLLFSLHSHSLYFEWTTLIWIWFKTKIRKLKIEIKIVVAWTSNIEHIVELIHNNRHQIGWHNPHFSQILFPFPLILLYES